MKRFWVFAGESYYAEGGMADYIGQFDNIADAIKAGLTAEDASWWHVLDTKSMKIVAHVSGSYTGQVPKEMLA